MESFVKRPGRPIVPVTKFPFHRNGPDEQQDWYTSIKRAKTLLEFYYNNSVKPFILILSDVQADDLPHEGETYYQALIKLGVDKKDIQLIREGQETVGQIEWLKKQYGDRCPILISVKLHAPRVRWICWRKKLKAVHITVGGKKRVREAITDFILIFAFPVIDLLGLTKWFQRWVIGRRTSGKH